MPIPSFPDAPPLTTDDAVLERVEQLVGPATAPRTLWLMFVDGDRRQAPVVVPIEGVPARPDDTVDALGGVLAGVVPDLATDAGPGSVVLVLERSGTELVTEDDRAWVRALGRMCDGVGVVSRGVFLSTRRGVRRLC